MTVELKLPVIFKAAVDDKFDWIVGIIFGVGYQTSEETLNTTVNNTGVDTSLDSGSSPTQDFYTTEAVSTGFQWRPEDVLHVNGNVSVAGVNGFNITNISLSAQYFFGQGS